MQVLSLIYAILEDGICTSTSWVGYFILESVVLYSNLVYGNKHLLHKVGSNTRPWVINFTSLIFLDQRVLWEFLFKLKEWKEMRVQREFWGVSKGGCSFLCYFPMINLKKNITALNKQNAKRKKKKRKKERHDECPSTFWMVVWSSPFIRHLFFSSVNIGCDGTSSLELQIRHDANGTVSWQGNPDDMGFSQHATAFAAMAVPIPLCLILLLYIWAFVLIHAWMCVFCPRKVFVGTSFLFKIALARQILLWNYGNPWIVSCTSKFSSKIDAPKRWDFLRVVASLCF